MSVEEDVIKALPGVLSVAQNLVELVSPRAAAAVGFGGEIAAFIIKAESEGMSPELIAEKVDALAVDLLVKIKFGA